MLERHPEGVEALPDNLWLDIPRKVRSVDPRVLEFTDAPPAPAGKVP